MTKRADILIVGGRIVDPAANMSEINDLAIKGGRIADVAAPSDWVGGEVFDATGYDVLPGLIDLHVHLSSEFAGRAGHAALVQAGVTTALDLAGPVADVMEIARLHGTGLTVGSVQRLKTEENLQSFAPSRNEIKEVAQASRTRGAIGIKVLGGHFPLSAVATATAVEVAMDERMWIAIHCGTTATPGDFRGFIEALGFIGQLPAHVAHINAYCRGSTGRTSEEALLAISALEGAPRLFTESYLSRINGTWGTCIDGLPESLATRRALEAGGYPATAQGLREALMAGYALAHVVSNGHVELSSGSEAVAHWESSGTRTGVSFLVNDVVASILLATARRGDGLSVVRALASDGGGIPRNDIIRLGYVLVRMGAMDLMELVRKASTTPAQYLGLRQKGHLSVGADADVAIVRSTDGVVVATIANGQFVFRDGKVVGRGSRWLALPEGMETARSMGLEVQEVDPFQRGAYGSEVRPGRNTGETVPAVGRSVRPTAD